MQELYERFPYLRHLESLAFKACRDYPGVDSSELEEILQTIWKEIESDAAEHGYDVFAQTLPTHFRLNMRALIAYLYGVPGASPHEDVAQLLRKEREYGGSWKKRGGVGAFMMGCRKFDRVEFAIHQHGSLKNAIAADQRPEGLLDDIGDLRRYLLLWESYLVEKELE